MNNLKTVRQILGINQHDLVKGSVISRYKIQMYEMGYENLSAQDLGHLKKVIEKLKNEKIEEIKKIVFHFD